MSGSVFLLTLAFGNAGTEMFPESNHISLNTELKQTKDQLVDSNLSFVSDITVIPFLEILKFMEF